MILLYSGNIEIKNKNELIKDYHLLLSSTQIYDAETMYGQHTNVRRKQMNFQLFLGCAAIIQYNYNISIMLSSRFEYGFKCQSIISNDDIHKLNFSHSRLNAGNIQL